MTSMVREAVVEYRGRNAGPKIVITSSLSLAAWAMPLIGARAQESFLVVALNARHEVVSYSEIGRGGLTFCPVSPADVFRFLLLAGTPAAIFVHNHPSQDPTPSQEDVELTKRLVEASKILGIKVVDHVVVCEDRYVSFLDCGLLPT